MSWETTILGDFAPFVYGKALPKRSRETNGHVDVFGSGGVCGQHDEALTNGPTVIVGRKGTVGKVYFSPNPCWPIDTTFFVEDDDPLLARFKYYALQTLGLDGLSYDSAVPGLKRDHAHSLQLRLPSTDVQRHVAAVLCVLDDLIENNRRRIEILEEIARTLYREWFVHFRFPGHEDVKLVDSDLGTVPDGWEVARVADALVTAGGGTPPKQVEDYWLDGEIPWFTPTDLTRAGSTYVFESGSKITELGLKKSSAKLFPAGSVMMTSRATIGVVSISTAKASTNQGFITCVPSERLTSSYIYHWLQDNVSLFLNLAGGATFKELRKSTFRELLILVPSGQQMEEFEGQVGPMMALIRNLLRQSELLREARDLLLPRLVSGELDVSELDLGSAAV